MTMNKDFSLTQFFSVTTLADVDSACGWCGSKSELGAALSQHFANDEFAGSLGLLLCAQCWRLMARNLKRDLRCMWCGIDALTEGEQYCLVVGAVLGKPESLGMFQGWYCRSCWDTIRRLRREDQDQDVQADQNKDQAVPVDPVPAVNPNGNRKHDPGVLDAVDKKIIEHVRHKGAGGVAIPDIHASIRLGVTESGLRSRLWKLHYLGFLELVKINDTCGGPTKKPRYRVYSVKDADPFREADQIAG